MTSADSNTYWAIGNKSPASNGLLLSGAAGGIRMVPANSTVTVKGNVDMENNGAVYLITQTTTIKRLLEMEELMQPHFNLV